nr:MAG TPA: hypothetical protein [Caudoviricetes sp.]
MSNLFSVASIVFFIVTIFFLSVSAISTVRMIIRMIKKDEDWEENIVALVVTAFMGVIALGISALSFIASRHF